MIVFLPSIATSSPFSKVKFNIAGSVSVTCVGQASSGKPKFDVSVSLPPTDVPQIPLLIEYLLSQSSFPPRAFSGIQSPLRGFILNRGWG
jgi:hypothetical protein